MTKIDTSRRSLVVDLGNLAVRRQAGGSCIYAIVNSTIDRARALSAQFKLTALSSPAYRGGQRLRHRAYGIESMVKCLGEGRRIPIRNRRMERHGLACAAVLGLCFAPGANVLAQDGPPIVKPGAPGEATRMLSPEESIAFAQAHFTEADAHFMQMMIIHHGQAVEMGDLIEDRTDNPGIRLMGDRIARSQATEIAMMRTWLQRRGQPLEPASMDHMHHGMSHTSGHSGGHQDHMSEMAHDQHDAMDVKIDPKTGLSTVPLMSGMLSPAQMAELAAADGAEFDRLFLTGMIHHHQGAIDMVNGLMSEPGNGEDPELSEFLAAVVADQSAEINRMQFMLTKLEQNK